MNKIEECIEENLKEIVKLYFAGNTVVESIQEVMSHKRVKAEIELSNNKK